MVGRLDPVVQLDAERKPQLRAVLDGLLAVGAPDTITLSIGAARLLERRFDVAPVGEPGTPARVYRLAGGERAGLRRATRFVGRDAELRFLRERLAAAVGGRGQVVGISGDPGIGKSRLLDEFQRSLGDGEVTWLEGRCFSYLTATPYAPVIQMLRATLGLGETDGGAVVADKARRALVQVSMDPDEAVPYLLLVLGVGEGTEGIAALSADAIRGRTFDILTEMTLRGSQRRLDARQSKPWGPVHTHEKREPLKPYEPTEFNIAINAYGIHLKAGERLALRLKSADDEKAMSTSEVSSMGHLWRRSASHVTVHHDAEHHFELFAAVHAPPSRRRRKGAVTKKRRPRDAGPSVPRPA